MINYSEHGTIVDNIIYTLNPVTGHGDTKIGSHFQTQPSSSNMNAYSINNNAGDHHSDKINSASGKKGASGNILILYIIPHEIPRIRKMFFVSHFILISAASKMIAGNYKPGSQLKTMSSNVHQFNTHEKEWRPCNCSDSIQRTMNVLNDDMRGGCENSALLQTYVLKIFR